MNAPSRSGQVEPSGDGSFSRGPALTERARDGALSPGGRAGVLLRGPRSRSVSTPGPGAAVGTPRPAAAPHRYCTVKGCGKRIVRGRLGFLRWVHAERADTAHYARP